VRAEKVLLNAQLREACLPRTNARRAADAATRFELVDEMCRHIANIESELLTVPEVTARLKAIAELDGSSRHSHRDGCRVNMEIIGLGLKSNCGADCGIACDKSSGAISIAATSFGITLPTCKLIECPRDRAEKSCVSGCNQRRTGRRRSTAQAIIDASGTRCFRPRGA
jgi:hypothetical protein